MISSLPREFPNKLFGFFVSPNRVSKFLLVPKRPLKLPSSYGLNRILLNSLCSAQQLAVRSDCSELQARVMHQGRLDRPPALDMMATTASESFRAMLVNATPE